MDLSGIYAVTISASPQCATGTGTGSLPDEARQRTYALTVAQEEQQGPRLDGVFSGPGVVARSFEGRAEPGRLVWFVVNPNEWGPDDVLEDRLPSGAVLTTRGTAILATSGTRFVGALSGTLTVRQPFTAGPPLASCTADDHQFEMTR